MAGKRAAQKAATAARITATARELFIAQGYEAVGMRELAAAAGVSTGAIFASFASKDDLWFVAMGRHAPNKDRVLAFLRGVQAVAAGLPIGEGAVALQRDLYGPEQF